MNKLPDLFTERIKEIFPSECQEAALKSFSSERVVSIRINSLKIKKDIVLAFLKKLGVPFLCVPWHEDALVLPDVVVRETGLSNLVNQGCVYAQSLSSMLVPCILCPGPGETVLDVCAAPGSKTTQMAAMMKNDGSITALENIKGRYYRLRSVVSLLGAENVRMKLIDARRFRGKELFDKILVDAPCSSEGIFRLSDKKTFAYWSSRKIKEMQRKQKGILFNAFRLLKPGGVLVYSTCTFSPEENEAVVSWVLRKAGQHLQVEEIFLDGLFGEDGIKLEGNKVETYRPLTQWKGREFNKQVERCVRILPNKLMQGFFIARMRKD